MNESVTSNKTGGLFLLNVVGEEPIFTREQFSEEHQEIGQMVVEFSTEKIATIIDDIEKQDKELSCRLLREMGELGLLSIAIPEKYDGLNMDKTTSIIVAESMAHGRSGSFTTTWSVQTGIGMLPIVWFGNDKQKEKYLPKLASAEWIGAYALTEPESGSDAISAKTTAILSKDGKYYILNGEKQFITNGGWADVYTLFAQVDGSKFTAFIIDRNTPGLEIGPEEHKLGVKGSSTVSLKLNDAKVPAENVLGEIGGGATIAFNALNIGRLKLGASVLGGSKEVINVTIQYALERRQFGQSIAYFDAIKKKIADMTVRTYALDSIIYRTMGMIDQVIARLDHDAPDFYLKMGEAMEHFAIESSMVKVFGSETLGFCTDTGIQIHGGYGYIEDYPIARIYRDTRIDRIWEGTNEINRQIITGYFMKKTLLDEIPLRERIKNIDPFLSSENSISSSQLFSKQHNMIEAGKYLTLFVFDEALKEFGQDLKHNQQLGELLADMFLDLYLSDSTVTRVKQVIQSNGQHSILSAIAQVFTAEMALRLLNQSLTGLNDIYHGNLPESIINILRNFQVRLLPRSDVAALKRQIAEYVYLQHKYPF